MWPFCSHDWKVIDKTILPAPMEGLMEGISRIETGARNIEVIGQKRLVITLQCPNCHRVKQLVQP